MPEHVHLLLTPAHDITLERSIQFIKGGYSQALGVELDRKGEVWQRGFTDHRIRDSADFEIHRRYIHENPVKRGLVTLAPEYRYCSAFPGSSSTAGPQRLKPRDEGRLYGTTGSRALPERGRGESFLRASKIGKGTS